MQFGDFSPVPLRFLLLFLVETGFVSALLQGGKTLTPPELDAFRSTFLSKMGVTSTPAAPFTASPIPNYLWDIYSAIRHGGRNGVNVPEFADCVRNYFPNQTIIDDQGLLHLHFNLSSEKSVTDQRLRVELRVRHPDILQNSPGRIALYEVIDGCRDVRRLLDTKVIKDMKKTDWISLDASPAVSRTLSLHLIVAMVDVNSTEHFANHSISSAAIVIFSVSEDSAKSARPKRSTAQETEADEEAQSRRRWKNGQAAQEPKIRSRVAPIRQICQRHAVYVDFVQLNWQHYCATRCYRTQL
uniref:TGF-beta propeptide domain-containing protein n=1 Tax=Plectus sambesii TaxID=2011161 RepID=A0A914UPV0_9BILA